MVLLEDRDWTRISRSVAYRICHGRTEACHWTWPISCFWREPPFVIKFWPHSMNFMTVTVGLLPHFMTRCWKCGHRYQCMSVLKALGPETSPSGTFLCPVREGLHGESLPDQNRMWDWAPPRLVTVWILLRCFPCKKKTVTSGLSYLQWVVSVQ